MAAERIAELPRVGNALCLDLVNVVEPRVGEVDRDHLQAFDDLVEWAARGEVIDAERAAALRDHAARDPAVAARAHGAAIELRETMYAIFASIASDDVPPAEALDDLATAHADLIRRAGLAPKGDSYCWDWSGPCEDPEVPLLGPVAASAIDLLRAGPLDRLKACPVGDGGCGWLFVDTTKNRSRRWCSMEDCGGRAKARRHYRRHREARTAAS